jgi:hypothetical protein
LAAHFGRWRRGFEGLFSPKEALKRESQGAAIGTQRTLKYLRGDSEIDYLDSRPVAISRYILLKKWESKSVPGR